MKDHILMFTLAFILWAWFNLRLRRRREQIFVQKKTKEKLLKRLKNKNESKEKQGRKSVVLKNFEGFRQSHTRLKTNAYPYLQQERRTLEERRKSRVLVGLIFENVDRRKGDSISYKGFEKRSGMDRRGNIWDRRKPKVACYGHSLVDSIG
jgi:hypothetical protein